MARTEIAEKLNTILEEAQEWGEPVVTYLFVQLRKMLDHSREDTRQDLPHLRFYSDWVVHISKDRIDSTTLTILKNLEDAITEQIKNPNIYLGQEAIDFAYFKSLKLEVLKLLKIEAINTKLLEPEASWTLIIAQLVKILENQPLNILPKYNLNLKELIFLPSASNCVIMYINFNTPIVDNNGKSYPYYKLMNAY